MESAFEALEYDAADRAVLPVENSVDGVIERNYDLMLCHPELHVVGEGLLPINHCLLARGRPRSVVLKEWSAICRRSIIASGALHVTPLHLR